MGLADRGTGQVGSPQSTRAASAQSGAQINPPPALVRRAGRVFRDRHGEWWCVYEFRPRRTEAWEVPALIFESLGAMRRVRHYPKEWRALKDAELEALSWHS